MSSPNEHKPPTFDLGKIRSLKLITGIRDIRQMIDAGFGLLWVAAIALKNDNSIAIVDKDKNVIQIIEIPALHHIRPLVMVKNLFKRLGIGQ